VLHESCILEVAPETVVTDSLVSACNHSAQAAPVSGGLGLGEQVYAMDATATGNFTQMNSSWTVPPVPSQAKRQIVYLWPGFKATAPAPGYPVLQPVLQYGQRGKTSWQLQSWFVYAKRLFPEAFTGHPVDVSPGDTIRSYMEFDAATQIWTVYGRNERTQQASVLQVSKSKAGGKDFNYAMHVMETIMPSEGYCTLYPASSGVSFTGISAKGGEPLHWAPSVLKTDCGQKCSATAVGDTVSMSWNSSGVQGLFIV